MIYEEMSFDLNISGLQVLFTNNYMYQDISKINKLFGFSNIKHPQSIIWMQSRCMSIYFHSSDIFVCTLIAVCVNDVYPQVDWNIVCVSVGLLCITMCAQVCKQKDIWAAWLP